MPRSRSPRRSRPPQSCQPLHQRLMSSPRRSPRVRSDTHGRPSDAKVGTAVGCSMQLSRIQSDPWQRQTCVMLWHVSQHSVPILRVRQTGSHMEQGGGRQAMEHAYWGGSTVARLALTVSLLRAPSLQDTTLTMVKSSQGRARRRSTSSQDKSRRCGHTYKAIESSALPARAGLTPVLRCCAPLCAGDWVQGGGGDPPQAPSGDGPVRLR